MTKELEPLKECPFCGGEARLVKNEGLLSYVNCTICNASTGFDDARGAVKTWNTRYKRTCKIGDGLDCSNCGAEVVDGD